MTVTIVGRSQNRLDAVAATDAGIATIAADVSRPQGRDLLVARVLVDPVPLAVLVSNAGAMTAIDLRAHDALHMFDQEIALDLTASAHLPTALLPHLLSRSQPVLVDRAVVKALRLTRAKPWLDKPRRSHPGARGTRRQLPQHEHDGRKVVTAYPGGTLSPRKTQPAHEVPKPGQRTRMISSTRPTR